MSAYDPIQTSFIGGEVTPRAHGQVGADFYPNALALCDNWVPMRQGSLIKRSGSDVVASAVTNVAERFFKLRSKNEDFLIELSNSSMRVQGGVTVVSVTAGWPGWTLDGPYFLEEEYGPASLVVEDTGQVASYVFVAPVTGTYTLSFSILLETGNVRITAAVSGGAFSQAFTNPTTFSGTMSLTAGTTYTVTFTSTTGHGLALIQSARLVTGAGMTTVSGAPWTSDQLADVVCVPEPGRDRVLFFHKQTAIRQLVRSAAGVWTLTTPTITGTPWNTANGYPAFGDFYQGRLVVGGHPDEGNRFWMSKVPTSTLPDNIYDFGLGTSLAGDGLDLRVATKGAIQAIKGGRTLLLGTDLGELSVRADAGVITPADKQIINESFYGCASVPWVDAGPFALYVGADRRTIRAIAYDDNSQNWDSADVSVLADHLLDAGIKELHYARTPQPTIVALTNTGKLVGCVFGKGVSAWYRITPPDASQVLTAQVLEVGIKTYIVAAVVRGKRCTIERFALEEGPILDAHAVFPLTPGQTTIDVSGYRTFFSGGASFYAVIDGERVSPAFTIGLSDTLTLTTIFPGYQNDGSECVVGFRYDAAAKTLPLEGGNPSGTSQGSKIHRTDLRLRVNDSAMPLLNGERTSPTRTLGDPINQPAQRRTGDVRTPNLRVDEGGIVDIEQDLPLRTEVCALFGRTQVNKV